MPATLSRSAGPSLGFTDAEIARFKKAFRDASGASGALPVALLGVAVRRAGKDASEDELRGCDEQEVGEIFADAAAAAAIRDGWVDYKTLVSILTAL